MKRIWVIRFIALGLIGCAPQSSAPKNEVHYVLPDGVVPAGQEVMRCWYATMPTDVDVYATVFKTEQAPGGHHLVGFTTSENVPDGTVVDCSGPDAMLNWQPLLTGVDKGGFAFPAGYAVKVPAHTRLVFQSHYLNATTAPITTHDEVTISFTPDAAGLTLVGTLANTTLDFSIAAGATKTSAFECAVTQPMSVFSLLGHMHEWGKSISIEAGPAAAPATLYDIADWSPTYRDHPPTIDYGFDHPLELAPGDVIRTSCTWQNSQSTALTFPKEMCVSLFWFYPADASLTCVRSTAN